MTHNKSLLKVTGLLACLAYANAPDVLAQNIQNPLLRPQTLSTAAQPVGQGEPKGPGAGAAPRGTESGELRDKAEKRLTQEDLNIQQQALNATVLPAPLQGLFSNMFVTAFVQGAVVLRRAEVAPVTGSAPVASSTSQSGQGANASAANAQRTASAGVAGSVIRLKIGKVTNVSGYPIRARVDGQDIAVDWLSSGNWINVFVGAIESTTSVAQVPADDKLEKVQTKSFDHLIPILSSRLLSSSGNSAGNGSSGNNSNGSLGGGGQSSPGFGSGSFN